VSELPPECPLHCPNRKQADASSGKATAYVFALIASLFLGWQCVSSDRQGKEVPVLVWMPCLLLIGGALGVQIDPSSLSGLLKK